MSAHLDDIRSTTRSIFFDTLRQIRTAYKDARFVLIVDTPTLPLISSIMDMSELVDKGVVLVESYERSRKPLPNYHAIYLLNSSTDVEQMIKDFIPEPKYLAPHYLCTYSCTTAALDVLRRNPKFVDRLLTMKDMFISYTVNEEKRFTVAVPTAFNSMYSPAPRTQFIVTLNSMIEGIISFLMSMKLKPEVFYPRYGDFAQKYQTFAQAIESQFSSICRGSSSGYTNTAFIIIPRAADTLSPLLHQFSYEAMVNETLPMQNDCCILNEDKPDEGVPFNVFQDKLFREIRYTHFAELQNVIQPKFNEIAELEEQKKTASKEEVKKIIKTMVQRKAEFDSVQNHYTILSRLSDIVQNRDLANLSEFEQRMATGKADASTPYKLDKFALSGKLVEPNTTEIDKLRLIAIFMIRGGKFSRDELVKVMDTAHISQRWLNSLLNIQLLGQQLPRKDTFDPAKHWSESYIPLCIDIVKGIIQNKVDTKNWAAPSTSSYYQNFVVFFAGGVSFMEIKELNKFAEENLRAGKKLFIGATNTLNPVQLLTQIKGLQ